MEFTKFRHHRRCLFFLLIVGLPGCLLAAAPLEDLNITADNVDLNRQVGITIFTGHVKLDQGTTHLVADRLEIKSANNQIIKTTAYGDLARYWTTPVANASAKTASKEAKPSNIDAEAKVIEYYPQNRKIFLIGKASATQENNTIKSPRIEYNIDSGHLVSTATPEGRTVIVIQSNKFNLLNAKKTS